MTPSAIVIGSGSTGSAVAHDLALRGFEVTVVERGEIASGTTGRNHGLLHSGGRYAVKDAESAVECIVERDILARIMPELLELNGGLFIAVDEAGLAYRDPFLEACAKCGIPTRVLTAAEARELEPGLATTVLAAVEVPDGVFDPLHFCLAFLATARANGARIVPYTEVEDLVVRGNAVEGAVVRDRRTGEQRTLEADVVINATGPWADRIAAMAGMDTPVTPTAGVMVAVAGRFVDRVINRLDKPSDGDIVLPQRRTVVIGTSSWPVNDPDFIEIPPEHVALMFDRGGELVPGVRALAQHPRGVFAAARPLIGRPGDASGGRELSRTFECFDHASDGIEGFVTISGGKTTTARAMAERTVDVTCRKLGVDAECRTAEVPLLSYRDFYHG
ncbi:MAG TPA: FAD-dependent oxidoreductase [Candidatus Limnocylindrales bacterium]|nr:FAD-dependent oxidoreductase [Candidatus Limnocylindrales bacterium]